MDLSPLLEHPGPWRHQAKVLLASSDVLWHYSRDAEENAFTMAAASLLGGFALENLLKGVLVKQFRAVGEPILIKGRLRRDLAGHDLVQLAKVIGVPVARHEKFLLVRLTVTIQWGGRYVAPRTAGETDSATMLSSDEEAIRMFAAKLEDMLDGKEPLSYDDLIREIKQ